MRYDKRTPSLIFVLNLIVAFDHLRCALCANDTSLTIGFDIFIISEMENGNNIVLHCQSKDDDLGYHTLRPGDDFRWKFHLNIGWVLP
ncbi:hypothetical protein LguiB_012925 [Lonicera macranthoides]